MSLQGTAQPLLVAKSGQNRNSLLIPARYDWVWWSSLWLAVLAGLLVFTLRDKPPLAVSAA
jgi:hypothetical protein